MALISPFKSAEKVLYGYKKLITLPLPSSIQSLKSPILTINSQVDLNSFKKINKIVWAVFIASNSFPTFVA